MYLKFYTEGLKASNNCIAMFCSKGGRVNWGRRRSALGLMAVLGGANSMHIGHEEVGSIYLVNCCQRVDAPYVQSHHPALLDFIDRTYRVIGWCDALRILEVCDDDL